MEGNSSKTKSSIIGLIWMFFGNSFNVFSQLLILGILARLLTPEDFGVIGIILIFVNFSNIFTQMGIGTALVQLKTITEQHISQSYTLSIILGILIGVLFYFLAPYIGTFFNLTDLEGPIRFFSFLFPFKSFNGISTSILQRKLRFPAIVKTNTVSYLLGYGLTSITLAFLGYGLWSLIYGQLAILIVETVMLWYYQKPSFSIISNKSILKELMVFGSGYTLDTNFNFFAENSDNIIVGKVLGAASLGIYSRAFQFLALPASFFGKIYDKVLFPVLSNKQDDKAKLTSFYIFSISFCLIILFPISIILLFNAELIVRVLLGDQWLDVIEPFQVLIIGFAFRFGTRINKSFLKSLGLVYHGALYQFIFAVLMISSCLMGVYLFGLVGVALGVLFATVMNYLQVSFRIQKLLDFKYKYFLMLHANAFINFLPIVIVVTLTLFFGYGSIANSIIISIAVILPLLLIPVKNKKSIFYDAHNSLMFNQFVNNSPGIVK
ncbi:MAG: lipopolysaccharide biosynthesis protein, partial [Flavobacteriaceae bacterium]|nr:lipopolysaccharide biosynthesis protein [Flavobacteriaceae bacterium]